MMLFVVLRADKFFWGFVELRFTALGAKVVRLPLVFRFRGSGLGSHIHSAHWVFRHFVHSFRYKLFYGKCYPWDSVIRRGSAKPNGVLPVLSHRPW